MAQRPHIEIYPIPEDLEKINLVISNQTYMGNALSSDQKVIEESWANVEGSVRKEGGKIFSKPNLAVFHDLDERGNIFCKTTEYKVYNAVSRSSQGLAPILSSSFYDTMRIATIGSFLKSADDFILVHRRSKKAPHVPGFLDASCAGLCIINNGSVNPVNDLSKKLNEELNMSYDDMTSVHLKGIHSCASPDFSGLFSFGLETSLSNDDISKRMEDKTPDSLHTKFAGYEFIPRNVLADFIIYHYTKIKDMTGDVAMVLTHALNPDEARYVLSQLKDSGVSVKTGALSKGYFVEIS